MSFLTEYLYLMFRWSSVLFVSKSLLNLKTSLSGFMFIVVLIVSFETYQSRPEICLRVFDCTISSLFVKFWPSMLGPCMIKLT